MAKRNANGLTDYEDRLFKYIVNYTRDNYKPPTFENIIENVKGCKSKSTVFYHMNILLEKGFLKQGGPGLSYIPVIKHDTSVTIPKSLFRKILNVLLSAGTEKCYDMARELKKYMDKEKLYDTEV